MEAAAEKLVGEHDYRNLCKMDVGNGVINYKRKILKTSIVTLDPVMEGWVARKSFQYMCAAFQRWLALLELVLQKVQNNEVIECKV